MTLTDELERQALVIGLAARDDALAEDCNDQIGAFNAGALAFLTALRSAERKAPADVSGLVERIMLEHSDYTGGQGMYSAQKVREMLADALAARDAEIERLGALVHVPGVWRCPKCEFRLIQSNLNAWDGSVTARDEPGDKCPNCASPLWRVTYRDDVAEAHERWDEQVQRAVAAEAEIAALKREIRDHQDVIRSMICPKCNAQSCEAARAFLARQEMNDDPA